MSTPELKRAAPSAIGVRRARRGEELNLLAGQWYLGRQAAQVRTLLGSCVAVTVWHPRERLGGMCHFLLPQRNRRPEEPRDGRYGDEALELMAEAMQRNGLPPRSFEAYLHGGADTLPDRAGMKFNVGERNIEQGRALIGHYGFTLLGVDVGDHVPRHVCLNLADGEVQMRRGSPVK
jgi:chemotaxis protein CheD